MTVLNRVVSRATLSLCSFCFFLGISSASFSASFQVTPVRANLDAVANDTTFFQFSNTDSEPVSVQVEVMKWSQVDGQDVFEPTNDFVVVPRIISMEPEGRQIVRLGLFNPPESEHESSYRIFFTEIKTENSDVDNNISMRLRISIPIFVYPVASDIKPDLNLLAMMQDDDSYALEFINQGSQHIQLLGMQPEGNSDEGLFQALGLYILPGQSQIVPLEIPEAENIKTLEVRTDVGGKLTYALEPLVQ